MTQIEQTLEKTCIQDLVMGDIAERKKIGMERYGTLLYPFNNRISLQDAYEEVLDLAMYLRQKLEEDKLNSVTEITFDGTEY